MFDEPNPYARNLIFVSLLFIFYFWFDVEAVEPAVLSIFYNKFAINNQFALTITPWIFLAWFWIRYWQESDKKAIKHIKSSFYNLTLSRSYTAKLKKVAQEDLDKVNFLDDPDELRVALDGNGFMVTGVSVIWHRKFYIIDYKYRERSGSSTRPDKERITRINIYIIGIFASNLFRFLVEDKVFMRDLSPYVFSIAAVACGLVLLIF